LEVVVGPEAELDEVVLEPVELEVEPEAVELLLLELGATSDVMVKRGV